MYDSINTIEETGGELKMPVYIYYVPKYNWYTISDQILDADEHIIVSTTIVTCRIHRHNKNQERIKHLQRQKVAINQDAADMTNNIDEQIQKLMCLPAPIGA